MMMMLVVVSVVVRKMTIPNGLINAPPTKLY